MTLTDVLVSAQAYEARIQKIDQQLARVKGLNGRNQLLCERNYNAKCEKCMRLTIDYFIKGQYVPNYIDCVTLAKEAKEYGRSVWYAKYQPEEILNEIINYNLLPGFRKQAPVNYSGAKQMKKTLKQAQVNHNVAPNVVVTIGKQIIPGVNSKLRWNGNWDQDAELLFNNSEYIELEKRYGFPRSKFWQLAEERGLNTRLHEPVTIKKSQKIFYASHPDLFMMLVNGQHTALVNNFFANGSGMEQWVKRWLGGYYSWNGFNQPLTKHGNFTELTISMKKGEYTLVNL